MSEFVPIICSSGSKHILWDVLLLENADFLRFFNVSFCITAMPNNCTDTALKDVEFFFSFIFFFDKIAKTMFIV